MGIVEDIPDQTVMDADAVLKIMGFKGRIGYFFAYLGFHDFDGGLDLAYVQVIPDDEQVDPGIPVLDENPGGHYQLDLAGAAKALGQRVVGLDGYDGEQILQGLEVREFVVQGVCGAFRPAALADDLGFDQEIQFFTHGPALHLGATSDVAHGKSHPSVEEEETEQFHFRGTAEEGCQGFHDGTTRLIVAHSRLFEFDFPACGFDFLLDVFRVFFLDAILDQGRGSVDEVLGFFKP